MNQTTDIQENELITTEVTRSDLTTGLHWNENYELRGMFRTVGLVFALIGSPATAIPDVWSQESRRYDVATAKLDALRPIGRRISRSEALRIVGETLYQAEAERAKMAEMEAAVGLQWD